MQFFTNFVLSSMFTTTTFSHADMTISKKGRAMWNGKRRGKKMDTDGTRRNRKLHLHSSAENS